MILVAVFTISYRQERTLEISSVDIPQREAFYWAAILVTFALGTAVSDLATRARGLGFRNGVLLFGGLLIATWVASRLDRVSTVAAFWVAYILNRPSALPSVTC